MGNALPRTGGRGAVGRRQPQSEAGGPIGRHGSQGRLRYDSYGWLVRGASWSCWRTSGAAHRRHDHADGHLPRPAAAADAPAGGPPAAAADRRNRAELRAALEPAHQQKRRPTSPQRAAGVLNADGAYGSNVNHPARTAGRWDDGRARRHVRRKSFAYGGGQVAQVALQQPQCWRRRARHQNLESVELGVTTIDHYFDTLGGITRACPRAAGGFPVYIGDQTRRGASCARWRAGGAREAAPACSTQSGTRACSATATRACATSRMHVPTPWAGRPPPARSPWVYQQLTQTFVLDEPCGRRLAALNPTASARLANRLIEAHERNYWTPDADETLRRCGRPAKNSRTAWKASFRRRGRRKEFEGRRHDPAVPVAQSAAAVPDGDGSVQVHMDPNPKIGNAKVFAVYGKGGIGKSTTSRTCRSPSASSASACCRSAATPSTTRPSRSPSASVPTVIDVLERWTSTEELRPRTSSSEGYNGVMCVEAGRPAGGHRLRRLRRRPDGQAPEGAPPARTPTS